MPRKFAKGYEAFHAGGMDKEYLFGRRQFEETDDSAGFWGG